jgi:hypothetical protein
MTALIQILIVNALLAFIILWLKAGEKYGE